MGTRLIPTVETTYLINQLIERLQGIEQGYIPVECFVVEDIVFMREKEASLLAEETLLYPSGKCCWENIQLVLDNGFHVYAGERYGKRWVVGCISTSKGILTYG